MLLLNGSKANKASAQIRSGVFNDRTVGRFAVHKISGLELLCSEPLLCVVFDLLRDAHYQTRPSDLRYLLDVPYVHIWLVIEGAIEAVIDGRFDGSVDGLVDGVIEREEASSEEQSHNLKGQNSEVSTAATGDFDPARVVGVLMACEEGSFPGDRLGLTHAIRTGQRRPKGNLLAQRLCHNDNDIRWCQAASLRVMRVAVCQDRRREGVASLLIEALEAFALQTNCAYWGSSFSYSAESLAFLTKMLKAVQYNIETDIVLLGIEGNFSIPFAQLKSDFFVKKICHIYFAKW